MKALAEFIMRGRLQALLVAVVGAGTLMFSWVSAAAIALVTLRKGAGEGVWLLLWAALPAAGLAIMFGDTGPVAMLIGTLLLALVLRGTVSLPLAVLVSVPVGLATGGILLLVADATLALIVEAAERFFAAWEEQLAATGNLPEGGMAFAAPTTGQVAGLLGVANAALCVMSLCIARYWQAALYNPGGFGEEFRQLRLAPGVTGALLLAALGVAAMGTEYRTWAAIFAVPWLFAGLSLVHARTALRGGGTAWLAAFYVLWLVFDILKLMTILFAIADSWLDFRRRWQGPGSAPPARRDGDDE